jgi:hypothetical protein
MPQYFKKIVRTLDEETEYSRQLPRDEASEGHHPRQRPQERHDLQVETLGSIGDLDAACRGKYIFDLATAVNAMCFASGRTRSTASSDDGRL